MYAVHSPPDYHAMLNDADAGSSHCGSACLSHQCAQLSGNCPSARHVYRSGTPTTYANLYDADFQKLVNDTVQQIAVINPTTEAVTAILPYVQDKEAFYENLQYGTPFSCVVTTNHVDCADIQIFSVPIRTTEPQLAQHLIGYTRDGEGVTGLEADYNALLHSVSSQSSVTFTVNGSGGVLAGEQTLIRTGQRISLGVVTTLHKEVQQIL